MAYETCLDEIVRARPRDEMYAMLQYVCGQYPRTFFSDPFERQPLATVVLDDVMQREDWPQEKAVSLLKFYHWP